MASSSNSFATAEKSWPEASAKSSIARTRSFGIRRLFCRLAMEPPMETVRQHITTSYTVCQSTCNCLRDQRVISVRRAASFASVAMDAKDAMTQKTRPTHHATDAIYATTQETLLPL